MPRQSCVPYAVALVLTACTGGQEATQNEPPNGSTTPIEAAVAPALVGTRWEWVSTVTPVERTVALSPMRYTLELLPDGRAQVLFDCNRGSGSYELAENKLTFGPMLATRMACAADTQDNVYMEQLGKIASYFMRDGELYLEMPYDSGTMRFRPASDQE